MNHAPPPHHDPRNQEDPMNDMPDTTRESARLAAVIVGAGGAR